MEYRPGNPADLAHLETFVWQAIFPSFDHPDLTDEQRATNDQVVEEARSWAVRAMGREDEMLYVAHDSSRKQLAGLIWAKGGSSPRIVLIIVARRYWGQGVSAKLLEEATFWLGDSKPVSAHVRYYNERAQAFFAKHGFDTTEQADDDFPIRRIILVRPAGYQSKTEEDLDQLDLGFEFPEPEPEPENAAEELLDLTEPFAQRRSDDAPPVSKFPHIELEIESGEEEPAVTAAEQEDGITAAEAIGDNQPPFEFAFQSAESTLPDMRHTDVDYTPPPLEPLPEIVEEELLEDALVLEEITEENKSAADKCRNCGADLPPAARFCPQCGLPVGEPVKMQNFASSTSPASPSSPTPPDTQVEEGIHSADGNVSHSAGAGGSHLRKSEKNKPLQEEPAFETPDQQSDQVSEDGLGGIDWSGSLMTDFRAFFKDRFRQRVQDYFGLQAVGRYEEARRHSDFQQTVSTQLAALADWVRNHRGLSDGRYQQAYDRLVIATEALIEYFLVEEARKLHGGIWPQRLLRHQALSWENADLFSMAMDYLDFEQEAETVYTDFVRMPAKVLKNATSRFLNATRDERVLFVCDQSLLGSGKDGFAMTDVAIYWRPVLQGPKRVLYQEIETIEKQTDHLRINKLYFDAGESLNVKMALFLRRLATMVRFHAA